MANGVAEKNKAWKTKLNAGRKKAESERSHVAAKGEKHELPVGTLLVGHEPHGEF